LAFAVNPMINDTDDGYGNPLATVGDVRCLG
jgi:hypothetical protein